MSRSFKKIAVASALVAATTTYKGIRTITYNYQLIAYDQDGVVTE